MHFAFTDEQLAFRDAVRDLLEKECTPAHVRSAWTNTTGRVPGLWDQLAGMGVTGMLVAERDGGLGQTMTDLVLHVGEFLLLVDYGSRAAPPTRRSIDLDAVAGA